MRHAVRRGWLRWVPAAVVALFLASCTGAGPAPVTTTAPMMAPTTPRSVPSGVVADPEVLKQVPYAAASPAQVLHLSLPNRTGHAVPAVVLVHGGGFYEGSKADVRFLVEALNARGYATAAIDYRLSGEAPFPAAVQDVTSAIRWVRANAAVHGIDPGRIAVWGLSAGGNLAAMAAVTAYRGTLTDPEGDPADGGDPQVTGAVQAVVSWYAPMDFATMDAQAVDPGGCPGQPGLHNLVDSAESRYLGAPVPTARELVRASSPATYLDGIESLPPFYLAHGNQDCIVPFAQTLEFADAVRAVGGQVSVDIVAGAGHATPEVDRTQVQPSIDFLDEALNIPS